MSKPVWHIEIRQQEKFAWVIDPGLRPLIRYLKTHRCVYYVPCPTCKARIGEPCVGSSGQSTATVHPLRRDVFYKRITMEMAKEQVGRKILFKRKKKA